MIRRGKLVPAKRKDSKGKVHLTHGALETYQEYMGYVAAEFHAVGKVQDMKLSEIRFWYNQIASDLKKRSAPSPASGKKK